MVFIGASHPFRAKHIDLVAALLCIVLISGESAAEIPRGVFCLLPSSTGGDGKDPVIFTDPNVDGVSVRQHWCDLEPREGAFDWTFLDTVLSKAAAGGKKVFLRIGTSGGDAAFGGNTPTWVFDAIDAEALPSSQKFFTFNESGTVRTIPVFWDPVYLAKKKAMIAAVGARYSNHPAVKIVGASFANAQSEDWSVPHMPVDAANWFAAGYATEKMLNAGKQIIDATMTAFPYQYVALAVGGTSGTLDPDDSYVPRNAVLAARTSWPNRLIVQKNSLATNTPAAPGTGTRYQLLSDSAPDIAGQMLWYCFGDPTYSVNRGVPIEPSIALRKSVDIGLGYGMKYIEIYRTDILDLPDVTRYAHNALTAALPTPSPSPTPSPIGTPTPTPPPTPTPTGTWADLKISVSDPNTSVMAGQKNAYTIVVTNSGPYKVTGAVVTDNFPNTFTDVTFTATQTGGATGATATGTGNINDRVTIPVGGFITYKAAGKISSSATDTISNTVNVAVPNGVSDFNLSNNGATDTNAISTQADLRIGINDRNPTARVGENVLYTIVVANSGPSDVVGAVVKDISPNNFTGVIFTATQIGGASGFSAAGSGNINDTVTMPADSRITYKVKGKISSAGNGTISNTATVVPPGNVPDPDPANNSATDTDTLFLQADLRITVTNGRTSLIPGAKNTYTIAITNLGPSDVTGAVVKDNFPAEFTGVTFTATQTGGASSFTASGNGNINDAVTLPADSHIIYKAKGKISSSAAGTISNTATVVRPNNVPDPDPTNNSATDIDRF